MAVKNKTFIYLGTLAKVNDRFETMLYVRLVDARYVLTTELFLAEDFESIKEAKRVKSVFNDVPLQIFESKMVSTIIQD